MKLYQNINAPATVVAMNNNNYKKRKIAALFRSKGKGKGLF